MNKNDLNLTKISNFRLFEGVLRNDFKIILLILSKQTNRLYEIRFIKDKLKFRFINPNKAHLYDYRDVRPDNYKSIIKQLYKFRFKNDLSKSIDIFGFRKIKQKLENTHINIDNIVLIEYDYTCKKDNNNRNIMIINVDNKNYKFLLEDIIISYPDIDKFNLPKDRIIRVGDDVKCIKDKENPKLSKNNIYKVVETEKEIIVVKSISGLIKSKIKNFKKC